MGSSASRINQPSSAALPNKNNYSKPEEEILTHNDACAVYDDRESSAEINNHCKQPEAPYVHFQINNHYKQPEAPYVDIKGTQVVTENTDESKNKTLQTKAMLKITDQQESNIQDEQSHGTGDNEKCKNSISDSKTQETNQSIVKVHRLDNQKDLHYESDESQGIWSVNKEIYNDENTASYKHKLVVYELEQKVDFRDTFVKSNVVTTDDIKMLPDSGTLNKLPQKETIVSEHIDDVSGNNKNCEVDNIINNNKKERFDREVGEHNTLCINDSDISKLSSFTNKGMNDIKSITNEYEGQNIISNISPEFVMLSGITTDVISPVHVNKSSDPLHEEESCNTCEKQIPIPERKSRKLSKSSPLCLDKLEEKWEAFFFNNMSRNIFQDPIPSFKSSSTTSIPPSSTEYRYRSRRKQNVEQYLQEDDTDHYEPSVGHDEPKALEIKDKGILEVKNITKKEAPLDNSNLIDRKKTDMDVNCRTAGSSNVKNKREYNFDLALSYIDALQIKVKQLGFFEKFPSSEVLTKAQYVLNKNRIIPPRNEQGISVPYPYIFPKKENGNIPHVDSIVLEQLTKANGSSLSVFKEILNNVRLSLETDVLKCRAVYDMVIPQFENCFTKIKEKPRKTDILTHNMDITVLNNLFDLCGYIGLPCVIIDGRRKDFYGDKFQITNASWAAVLIHGQWRLIDPQLPFLLHLEESIFYEEVLIKARLKEHYRFIYDFLKQFYFLRNPIDMINSHFPTKLYWQLLCRSVSEGEWNEMVQLTPFFFMYELLFLDFTGRSVISNGQNFNISMKYPNGEQIIFAAILRDIESKRSTRSSSFVENDIGNSTINVACKAPKCGDYVLRIFCRDISVPFYICVCNVKLRFIFEDKQKPVLFPTALRQQWGPGHDTCNAGLIALTHTKAVINVEGESVLIQFKLRFSVGLSCHLLNERGDSCDRNILYWFDDRIVNILITSPGEGTYTFSVFSSDGKNFSSGRPSCSYVLIFNTNASNRFQNFEIPNRKLGLTDFGYQQKCSIVSNQSDFIHAPESGMLEFKLRSSRLSDCTPKLRFHGDSVAEDMNNHIAWFTSEEHMLCTINLPKQGDYLLFFSSKSENGALTLYYALIHVQIPSRIWAPFPKRLMQHTNITVRIIEPHSGMLPAKADIYFRVELKCDCDVAIKTSKGWFHLDQTEENHWEGHVTTGVKGTEVKLVARFEVGSDVFTPLLVYKIATADEIERKTCHQQKLRETALKYYLKSTVDDVNAGK